VWLLCPRPDRSPGPDPGPDWSPDSDPSTGPGSSLGIGLREPDRARGRDTCQDWAAESRRRRRERAAGDGARHSRDGRPVDALEVDGRCASGDSSTDRPLRCRSQPDRQLRAAASTSRVQRVLPLPLHVRPLRHLVLREYTFTPHRVHRVHRCGLLLQLRSVCLSVCLSGSCAKPAEPTEMPSGE